MSDLTDPPRPTEDFEDSSSSEDSDDQCWDDWVEDPAEAQPCRPLFGDQEFPTVLAALEHDKSQGFDLRAECIRLGSVHVVSTVDSI
jgi:protein arginine N-methyltransferase 3